MCIRDRSTAKSYLALYRDPVVQRNVSQSEFRIKDLMNFDEPVSLYIVTHPNDKARLRPLVRVLINMTVRLWPIRWISLTVNQKPITNIVCS